MPGLDDIQTIVVVMMENRSFDNVLGHLRHPRHGDRANVEGLADPKSTSSYDNYFENQVYKPFAAPDRPFRHDLPHTRRTIATQLDTINGQPTMAGFVQAYVDKTKSRVKKPPPMGFLTPRWLPMSRFLADRFLICDHWFSPLPTGTQPNRAVAYSGSSMIEDNVVGLVPHEQESLVFDWLDRHDVDWRVYHSGLSFFLLFGCFDEATGARFRSIRRLSQDFRSNEPAPQVVFIEPEYADSPIHLGYVPNDNHPPLAMGPGEEFLRQIYTALTSNPAKWTRTLLIITYDEHGGFYDHVPPPALRTESPQGGDYSGEPFETLGVRVPTFAASPWVRPGAVDGSLFDHTSILQLLAEKFAGDPEAYSAAVTTRRSQGIQNASMLLTEEQPNLEIAEAPNVPIDVYSISRSRAQAPESENQAAFGVAARRLVQECQDRAIDKYPELAALPTGDVGAEGVGTA